MSHEAGDGGSGQCPRSSFPSPQEVPLDSHAASVVSRGQQLQTTPGQWAGVSLFSDLIPSILELEALELS